MKKHNIIALIGVLALTANLLIPGLAFGQAEGPQVGTLGLTCETADPTFSTAPASFDFYGDGVSTAIYAQSTTQYGYKDDTAITDYITVSDVREPSDPDCNDGLQLTVEVESTDGDLCYFETDHTSDNPTCGPTIPLSGVYIGTSEETCPAGYTGYSTGLCIENTALCGAGDNVASTLCDGTDGIAGEDLVDLAVFSDITTWGTPTAMTDTTPITIMNFADGGELYGEAGFGVTYAVAIPPTTQSGTYTLELLYTLTGL